MINYFEVMYMNRFKDHSRNAAFELIWSVIPSLPFLGFRLFREYLGFKSTADLAGKIFYDELLAQDIGPSIADKLTCSYLESRDLLRFIPKM
jgi:hypothetical protein